MNIGQIKVLAWGSAALLTLGLSYYVFNFVTHLEGMRRGPDQAEVRKILEQVQPAKAKTDDLTGYTDVKRLVSDLNWTGRPKPVETVSPGPATPPKPTSVPIKDLVRLLMIKVDLGDPKGSGVFLKYKTKAEVKATGGLAGGFMLHEGDHLTAPLEKIQVESIKSDGVTFAFESSDRAKETISPDEFDARTMIVQVGPGGVILPKINGKIPTSQNTQFRPGKTTKLGPDLYAIGTEDAKWISENYPEMLSQQVSLLQHRDPHSGKYDGIEITHVTPGSLAEQHGAQDGDVIKSINGHLVNSSQEAISFVKQNQGNYSTWEVIIENHGKDRTVTYHSPQQ
jgi:hypothetical protein